MPLYMLWGDEDFNIELRLNELKSDILKNDINPLNYRKFDNPPFNTLDEILRTQSLMFGNVLNVINAEKYFLNVTKKIELSDKQIEGIIKSFENLSPSNHVVFICNIPRDKTNKPDSRKKIYKALEKYGKIEHFEAFKPYHDYKAVNWARERIKKRKLQMGEKAIERLVEVSGVNLRVLDGQIDKLELMSYPEKKITDDMIDKICSTSQNSYALIDLILEKKFSKALNEISKIIENSHYLLILSFLQAAFSNLFYAKLYSKNLSSYEIARKTNQAEFIVKQNLIKVQKVELSELVRIKQNLVDAEFKLKTGMTQDAILALSEVFLKDRRADA